MSILREEALSCSSAAASCPSHGRTGRPVDGPCARIVAVEPESPADDAGFTPGCWLLTVDGHPLHDSIDWLWYSAEDEIEVGYVDCDGEAGSVRLYREEGEEWGFSFDGAIYDRIKLCRNSCTFCFMRQLPEEARATLVLRDDDFRLSFLQGTFVTLTNLTAEDEARIVEQRISPLRFSLHCISPEIRRAVIGKHAQHGIEACERLLEAGIEMHMQIVLMPGVNDGEELRRSLAWAYEHPGVVNVGIVPVGFTKHQTAFTESFNEVGRARAVIDCVAPVQAKAREERGYPWAYAADEFYRNAYPDDLLEHVPPTEDYGDFDMFEDGIGIIRSFIDDWEASSAVIEQAAGVLRRRGKRVHFVVGCAQKEFFIPLVDRSALAGLLVPFPVENDYFGGNVDVTGLLCACDIVRALKAEGETGRIDMAVVPSVVFNDDAVTLDDMRIEDIKQLSGVNVHVVSCNASDFLPEIITLLEA